VVFVYQCGRCGSLDDICLLLPILDPKFRVTDLVCGYHSTTRLQESTHTLEDFPQRCQGGSFSGFYIELCRGMVPLPQITQISNLLLALINNNPDLSFDFRQWPNCCELIICCSWSAALPNLTVISIKDYELCE
jgi:hypothetical protein